MEGYRFDDLHIEMAIARRDTEEVERRLRMVRKGSNVDELVALAQRLIALDRGAEIEEEAPALLKPSTYLEPFTLRALG